MANTIGKLFSRILSKVIKVIANLWSLVKYLMLGHTHPFFCNKQPLFEKIFSFLFCTLRHFSLSIKWDKPHYEWQQLDMIWIRCLGWHPIHFISFYQQQSTVSYWTSNASQPTVAVYSHNMCTFVFNYSFPSLHNIYIFAMSIIFLYFLLTKCVLFC